MELQDSVVRLEHRGGSYTVTPIPDTGPRGPWVVRAAEGRTVGTIILIAPEGEERDPVYGGCLPAEELPLHEGSDWESIARALINEVLER